MRWPMRWVLLAALFLIASPLGAAETCPDPFLGDEPKPLERFKDGLELGKDFIEKGLLVTGDNERPWLESTEFLEETAETFGKYAEAIELAMKPFEIAEEALRLKIAIDCATEGKAALLANRTDPSGALGMAIGLGELARIAADLLDREELFAVTGPMMLLRRAGEDFRGIVAIRGICRNQMEQCEQACRDDAFEGQWACEAIRAGVPPPACITLQECFLDKDKEEEVAETETLPPAHPTQAEAKRRLSGGDLSGSFLLEKQQAVDTAYGKLATAQQAWNGLNVFQRHFGAQRRVLRDRLQTEVCGVEELLARNASLDLLLRGFEDLVEQVDTVEPCPYKDRLVRQIELVLRTR
jgi:hypothetical protein